MRSVQSRTSDDGVTEVIGFTMILVMIFLALMIWLVVVMPDQIEMEETAHTADIQLEFADFKSGIDNLWMANNTGVISRQMFTLSSAGVKTETSMMPDFMKDKAFGTLSLEKTDLKLGENGTDPYMLRFTSSNGYAEDIEVIYFAGGIFVKYGAEELTMIVNGSVDPGSRVVIPILIPVQVNNWTKPSVSGSNQAESDYRLLEPVKNESGTQNIEVIVPDGQIKRMWSNLTGNYDVSLPLPSNRTILPKFEVSLR
jgi:hypothetical protein